MTQVTDSGPVRATPDDPTSERPGRRPRVRPLACAAGLLALAWLLPLAVHALGIHWIILPVLLVGTASLLRVGRTLLDRFMFALLVMMGAVLSGGVLFSLWPWGLEPVPVGGTLLTVLVAVGLATGRKPGLPVKVEGSDVVILGFGAYAFYMLHKPLSDLSENTRMLFTVLNDDRARHFSMFDAIHRVGGYTYFHADQARASMDQQMPSVYPPGSHFLYAFTDIFVRSDTQSGNAVAAYDRYVIFTMLGYAFLVVAVVWAARWVMGPTVTGWRRMLVCCTVGTLAATGQLVTLFTSGHDATMLAAGVLAVTVAVVVRPPHDVREQVLVAAAAVVTVSFTYNLFVLFAGAAVVMAFVVYRKRLTGHWVFTGALAGIAGPLALIPIVGPQLSGFSQSEQLLVNGASTTFSRGLLGAFIVASLGACLLSRAGRRLPVWRVLSGTLLLSVCAMVVFAVYQHAQLGQTSYYFEKVVQAVFVIALVGFGAVALLFKPGPELRMPGAESGGWRARVPVRWASPAAAGLAAVLFAGGLQWGAPSASWASDRYAPDTNYINLWADKRVRSWMGVGARDLAQEGLLGDGRPTLVFHSDDGTENWRISLFNAILNRDFGRLGKAVDGIYHTNGTLSFEDDVLEQRKITNSIEAAVRESPVPLRLLFANSQLAEHLRQFAVANPQLELEVRFVEELSHR